MRYFLDTEFYERGHHFPIELISLGLVAEDGREFYIENLDANLSMLNDWLKQNVVPYLDRSKAEGMYSGSVLPYDAIAAQIIKFVGGDKRPEFWGYFADYDWVLFSQLFGSMINLPPYYPNYCRDIKQLADELGITRQQLPRQTGKKHQALDDAKWHKEMFDFIMQQLQKKKDPGAHTVGKKPCHCNPNGVFNYTDERCPDCHGAGWV